MLAKIHVVISIEKQIISAVKNRFPFVNRAYQTRDMEKNCRPISVLILYHSYASLLANKGSIFSLLPVGGRWRVLMGSLYVTGRTEFE